MSLDSLYTETLHDFLGKSFSGLLIGLSAGFILFRTPVARRVSGGIGFGIGVGHAMAHASARFSGKSLYVNQDRNKLCRFTWCETGGKKENNKDKTAQEGVITNENVVWTTVGQEKEFIDTPFNGTVEKDQENGNKKSHDL